MQSFLINSSDAKFIKTKIDNLKKELSVSIYNYHEINPSPSIGISEIRKLISIVGRKPYDGGNRLIYLSEFDKATTEATNSILKVLEEPPICTYIVLSCSNLNNLLPTIISRCQIIDSFGKSNPMDEKNFEKTIKAVEEILKSSPGKRLIIAAEYTKTRESAINFLTTVQKTLSYYLLKDDVNIQISKLETAQILKKIQGAMQYLDRNVNTKAVIDILLLGFPQK